MRQPAATRKPKNICKAPNLKLILFDGVLWISDGILAHTYRSKDCA